MPSGRQYTLRFVLVAPLLMVSGPAAGDGIERSRGTLLEVMPRGTTTVFKHNANLDRVETDNYPVELGYPSRTSTGRRFYLSFDQIKTIGSTSDTLSTFTAYTAPAGMEPVAQAPCGSRVCIVFQTVPCSTFQIGRFAPGQEPTWSDAFSLEQECVRDMTSQSNELIVLTQRTSNPQLHQTRLHRFDASLGLIEGNRLGPLLEHIAVRVAKHYQDAASIFILSTNGGESRIYRVSVTTGATIAVSGLFDGEITFIPHDIAHYPAAGQLILKKLNDNLRRYDLVGFDQSTLAFRRTRRFSY
jgi:hypothetical protein